ncbi:22528_t:CDS:2, partial [Gigaspora rosea]
STPVLWLKPNDSTPSPRFAITGNNGNNNIGFDMNGYGFLLNQWYHIAYTLSNIDKRMNFYIDGEWVRSFSITNIPDQSIIFNDSPLYIGRHSSWNGFTGQISEILMDYSGKDPTEHNDDE